MATVKVGATVGVYGLSGWWTVIETGLMDDTGGDVRVRVRRGPTEVYCVPVEDVRLRWDYVCRECGEIVCGGTCPDTDALHCPAHPAAVIDSIPCTPATLAEQIAAVLGDDGLCWETDDGETLDALCEAAGGRRQWRGGQRGGEVYRWVLPDDSVITAAGAAWDLGYSNCYCWQGCEHDERRCEALAASDKALTE